MLPICLGPFELTRQTIHEYVTVLERVFLVERLPSWHTNRLSRLVKRPKLHIGDTGVACALLGVDVPEQLGEGSRVAGSPGSWRRSCCRKLRRQASWAAVPPKEFYHYRDRDDFEVDVVLEEGHSRRGRCGGEGGRDGARVGSARTSQAMTAAAGKRFVAGVVLYDGKATINFGEDLFAVPVRRLWET